MRCRTALLLPLVASALSAQYGTHPKSRAEDYPAHAKLENLSLGAEYLVRSFSGGGQTYIARDYIVVEVALFPAHGGNLTVDAGQFSLRVNGRKQTLAPQAPQFVAAALNNQDWDTHPHVVAAVGPLVLGAPRPTERFPGDPRAPLPPPPRDPGVNPSGPEKPPPVTAEELVVQAALPEGEHRGPVSGYLYFAYAGKIKRIHSLDLELEGSSGRVTLPLKLAATM